MRLNMRGSVSVPASFTSGPTVMPRSASERSMKAQVSISSSSSVRFTYFSRSFLARARLSSSPSRNAKIRPPSVCPFRPMQRMWSARYRDFDSRQSTMGSLKPPTWPEATQVFGFMMIVQSTPTMWTRSPVGPTMSPWTMSSHHAFLRFRLSSEPYGP